jgi:hypothetical protein
VVEQPAAAEEDLAGQDDAGGAAEAVDGVGGGGAALDLAEEGVLEIAAAGKGGEAAGFIDGQQVVVLPEDGEVKGGSGFDPGRAVPDESLAGGEGLGAGGGAPLRVTSPVRVFAARRRGRSGDRGRRDGRAGAGRGSGC